MTYISHGVGKGDTAAEARAAYVFARSGTTWTEQAILKAPNQDGLGPVGFAPSVAGSGDTV